MNNETKLKLASAGIDITEIIPADSLVVPKALWNDWAEKIEQMGNQQHATEAEPIQPGTPKMVHGEQPWKAIESDTSFHINGNIMNFFIAIFLQVFV